MLTTPIFPLRHTTAGIQTLSGVLMPKSDPPLVKAIRLEDPDLGRVVGGSLKTLRELAGLTQRELAERLDVGQAAISKIEHRGDVQISSLQKYVHALGGALRVEAGFSSNAIREFNINSQPPYSSYDDRQLVFPIFDDEITVNRKDVVLSVRPTYSLKIMKGNKTVELRRRFPLSVKKGTIAYIYSTAPVKALVGSAEIDEVLKLPVAEIWSKFSDMAQINRENFNKYFFGLDHGFALKFQNVRSFGRSIELSELRKRFGFEPPQSFIYANHVLCTALQNEYADLPN